ncbi:hypothetical protein [Streptomyces sp. TLI_171]|uniref:hypothetical protein n=1 Tax=Streptomyces sp. TLI_171 TaxID=1938859 RepID=UPI000C471E74|nr:hypothetical protein [Streptomyces sp. TLI_171]RKE17083.1 hypothetical protein BX266_0334 [Streptomyces sp. TLI_171]
MASRRALAAVAAVTVAAGLVLTGAQTAQADTGITVLSAHNDWTNNSKLIVELSAPSAITSVKVNLVALDTQQTVATLSGLQLAGGTTTSGSWTNRGRVQLPALGSYRIDVVATDEGGDTLETTSGVGYFYYAVTTNFDDATVDRTTVDYQHRTVTLSGHLMGRRPETGELVPMPGLTVDVTSYMEYTEVVTGADGSFTATLPVTNEYQNTIEAQFPYDPNHVFYNQSASKSFPIKIKKTATKIVENPVVRKVPFRGVVQSTSATLLWDSPTDGWQPLAGKKLGSNSFGEYVQRTTDAEGNALFPASPELWSDYKIGVGWPSDDLFLSSASAESLITVVQPAAFRAFTATRADDATVAVAGSMHFDGAGTPGEIPVDLQYSTTGKGGWTTVATTTSVYWNGEGYAFSTTVPGTASGYWRASFTGGLHFENAHSQVVYVSGT